MNKTIYDRIRDRRIELGMSQEDLAIKMGYKSRSTINKIESGAVDIARNKIEKFAEALNTSPAYLMGWDTEVPPEPTKSTLGSAILLRAQNELSSDQFKQLEDMAEFFLSKLKK